MSKRHIDGPPTRAKRTLRSVGSPPVNSAVRTAKMASIPIAFAGRHAAGVGKRVIGRSADEVSRDIQVRTAQHMFEVLGELKTGAAKLGQIMSIYELALPPEIAEPYRTALTRLQHSAPAMLPPAVHDVLAASMGANWRDNFRTFDDRQPQAASVGQVHRAQWHDGRAVAVKVQYPGARQAMKSDLAQLKRVIAIGSIFMPGADLKALAAELSDRISEELEYSIEAANQRSFAAAYDGDPDFFVPDVVAQCGDVLVSEWVEGTPLSNLIAWGKQSERDRIALLVMRFTLSGHLRCGLLYGDPHPGNFLVMPDGRLGVVDFGACSLVPESVIALAADMADAGLNGTIADLDAALRRNGFIAPDCEADIATIAAELDILLEPLTEANFTFTPQWLRARVLSATNLRLSNVVRQLSCPAELTAYARAIFAGAGVLCQLNSTGAFRDEIARWVPGIDEAIVRRVERETEPVLRSVPRS